MDVFDAIEKRRSIRNYEPAPIPRETLDKILEAAGWLLQQATFNHDTL